MFVLTGDSYVEPCGVKGAFGRDASRRVGVVRILKVALLQQALAPVPNGLPHGHGQSQGGSERDDARQEAEDQQDPLLQGQGQRLSLEIHLTGFKRSISTGAKSEWKRVFYTHTHADRVIRKQDKF